VPFVRWGGANAGYFASRSQTSGAFVRIYWTAGPFVPERGDGAGSRLRLKEWRGGLGLAAGRLLQVRMSGPFVQAYRVGGPFVRAVGVAPWAVLRLAELDEWRVRADLLGGGAVRFRGVAVVLPRGSGWMRGASDRACWAMVPLVQGRGAWLRGGSFRSG
jgi:hypothetical protein